MSDFFSSGWSIYIAVATAAPPTTTFQATVRALSSPARRMSACVSTATR